ncbi:hypothetical protein ACHAXT_009949 [Thalassiosira profunda]
MAFHPAAGRAVREDCVAGGGDWRPPDKNDEVLSDFSSDLDDPYHETAAEWYHRSARRRARRLAGISSSSSSEASLGGSEEADSEGDAPGEGGEEGKRMREMEKAVRSAKRPLERWLASYPLVAARCCLGAVPSAITDESSNQHIGQHNNYNAPPLSTREQEGKRLRRIFRRLRRKQKEYQAKFVDTTSASQQQANGAYYQNSNALSVDQMAAINRDCAETEKDRMAMNALLPMGTGISFLDAVLGRESLLQSKSAGEKNAKEQKTLSRLVLEMNGPAWSGMTSILLAAAARYVASTCSIFLGDDWPMEGRGGTATSAANDSADSNARPAKRRRKDASATTRVIEPRVVVLDLEKGVHAAKLVLAVREAVLRRWDETGPARQWRKKQQKQWSQNGAEAMESETNEVEDEFPLHERRQIELAIASCLGRIHVVQPKDFTYLSLVATVETLRHTLDEESALKHPVKTEEKGSFDNGKQQQAPTLILIDSLTTLDASTRFQESLTTTTSTGSNRSSGSSGLSDRNVFYRQLMRLRDEHEVVIIGASRSAPSTGKHKDSSRGAGGPRGSIWDKMVSHRVSLHHVAEGTAEDQAGYDFVAIGNASGNNDGPSVFPYARCASHWLLNSKKNERKDAKQRGEESNRVHVNLVDVHREPSFLSPQVKVVKLVVVNVNKMVMEAVSRIGLDVCKSWSLLDMERTMFRIVFFLLDDVSLQFRRLVAVEVAAPASDARHTESDARLRSCSGDERVGNLDNAHQKKEEE